MDSSTPKDEKSQFHLQTAAELFMYKTLKACIDYSFIKVYISYPLHVKSCFILFLSRCDAKALEDSLCKRVIVTRDETIVKCLDPEAATLSRDALAKIVYTRLFDW